MSEGPVIADAKTLVLGSGENFVTQNVCVYHSAGSVIALPIFGFDVFLRAVGANSSAGVCIASTNESNATIFATSGIKSQVIAIAASGFLWIGRTRIEASRQIYSNTSSATAACLVFELPT